MRQLSQLTYPPFFSFTVKFSFKAFSDHRDPHLLGPPLRPDPHFYMGQCHLWQTHVRYSGRVVGQSHAFSTSPLSTRKDSCSPRRSGPLEAPRRVRRLSSGKGGGCYRTLPNKQIPGDLICVVLSGGRGGEGGGRLVACRKPCMHSEWRAHLAFPSSRGLLGFALSGLEQQLVD